MNEARDDAIWDLDDVSLEVDGDVDESGSRSCDGLLDRSANGSESFLELLLLL